MASKGYITSLLNQLDAAIRKALQPAFDHALDDFILGTATKAANFRWAKVSSTTHADANTEFSVLHGIGTIPTWIIPVLDLNNLNSQIVPLTVSRAPDAQRLYLKSSSTSAAFTVMVEY